MLKRYKTRANGKGTDPSTLIFILILFFYSSPLPDQFSSTPVNLSSSSSSKQPIKLTIKAASSVTKEKTKRKAKAKKQIVEQKRKKATKPKKKSKKRVVIEESESESETSEEESDDSDDNNASKDDSSDESDCEDGSNEPYIWKKEVTMTFLISYEKHKPKFINSKYRAKKVWQIIQEDLVKPLKEQKYRGGYPTSAQCQNKWKSLMRGYKKTKLHNKTSGNNRATTDF